MKISKLILSVLHFLPQYHCIQLSKNLGDLFCCRQKNPGWWA
uniref:Uncharacterized protein n=1 Tax=uncultured Verrucomicrobiales bacterium HF0200_39L05 TaxID=710997 RepID=E0XUN9_9BACT|nr:hypothetical protein [uncultured Verrucomicrobiales bacterium HF0200_39L05]